jgi:hypothetical protein
MVLSLHLSILDMKKYDLPEFQKLSHTVDHHRIRQEFDRMFELAQQEGAVHCGRGNVILDLTYIDSSRLYYPEVRFAGSSTERAVSNYKAPSRLKNPQTRLSVGRQRDPLSDDRNHNCFKEFAIGSYTVETLASFGELTKATFALLEPNSWWPSHYDFSVNHAAKLNIPISTNKDVVSLAMNLRKQQVVKVHMKEGEVWWINSALKHTSFNWGSTNRLFLLATYRDASDFLSRVKSCK